MCKSFVTKDWNKSHFHSSQMLSIYQKYICHFKLRHFTFKTKLKVLEILVGINHKWKIALHHYTESKCQSERETQNLWCDQIGGRWFWIELAKPKRRFSHVNGLGVRGTLGTLTYQLTVFWVTLFWSFFWPKTQKTVTQKTVTQKTVGKKTVTIYS